MVDQQQRSGITYFFRIENEAAGKRFEDTIKKNNAAMREVDAAFKKTADGAVKNMKVTSDAVEDSANKTEKSSRKFIQSISGIYAAFVLAPRVAQEFGDALKDAAARKDVVKSFERLADSVSVNADRLLASMKAAAKGTVTEIELMREANRAFLAGGAEFALAIPQLFEIARATAAATGQEVIFVMDSLVKGIAKASIKLIDNAEVYIKVGKAVEDYAKSTGRTADELDEVERRQAILNVVLRQGQDIIRGLGGDVDFATDSFLRYETAVLDAKQATLEFFIDALGAENVGKLTALTDVTVDLSGALQTLALLAIASGKSLPAFLGTLAATLGRVGIAVLVLKEGLPAVWQVLQQIDSTLPDLNEVWSDWTRSVEFTRRALFDGLDAAVAWDEAIDKVSTTVHDASITNFAHAASLDALRAKQAEAAQAEEDRKNKVISIFEELSQAYAEARKLEDKRLDKLVDINQRIVKEMQRHVDRMGDLARDAAYARIDAIRDAGRDTTDAEGEFQRDVEDAHRQHRFNVEDIERRFQRRMTEIRERFELTVTKAGRRRNVLAIIDARERRAIEERSARRDRDDSLHNEARNFQESLRQAQEALADRQQELKDSLAEELRDIDENLRRRQEKEKTAHERRMRDLDAANEEELRKLKHQLSTIEFEIKRWRNQLQKYLNAHPVEIKYRAGPAPKPGSAGSLSGDTGFSGVVEGPTNFKVGPGITEYIYASGPIGGPGTRETPAPSAGATSAMALQHSIRGGINVGMNGLSSQLLSEIGPMLQDSVGQAIVDSLTAGILGSL